MENNVNTNNTDEIKKENTNETVTTNESITPTTDVASENVETSKPAEGAKNTGDKSYAINKNFFTDFFKTPWLEIKNVAANHKPYLIIAIIILAVWVVAGLIGGIITVAERYSASSFLSMESFMQLSMSSASIILTAILEPIVIVALVSALVFLFMKERKNFLGVATTITVSYLPVAVASVISLLGYAASEIQKLTNQFSSFCSVLSTVLLFFAIRAIYEESDDNRVTIKFIIVMAIYYAVAFVLSFFKMYI